MNNPLRIGLIMQGGRTWAGGSEYIKNIILSLANLSAEIRSTFELHLVCSQNTEVHLLEQIKPFLQGIHYLEKEQAPFTPWNRMRWKAKRTLLGDESPRLDDLFKRLGLDFVYPHLITNFKQQSFRACPWIPDFQHNYLPDLFSQEDIQFREKWFSKIASLSNSVVVSSKTAEADFHKFLPASDCKTEILQFRTVFSREYFQTDAAIIQKKYNLPDKFFIISNQFWQHKNHKTVFEALKVLQAQSISPVVVCTGHLYDTRNPQYIDEILQLVHTYGLSQQVYLLGMMPKSDQIQLMRRSVAIIQPSLFEGWSTVVEDARCLGKQILLSNFPVHLEQAPPNGSFFDGCSVEQLASIIASKWKTLLPGPHIEEELKAQKESYKQIRKFGERFLDIARSIPFN